MFKRSWDNTSHIVSLIGIVYIVYIISILILMIVTGAKNSMRLARPSLPIGKNSAIIALKALIHNRLSHLFINLPLILLPKQPIKRIKLIIINQNNLLIKQTYFLVGNRLLCRMERTETNGYFYVLLVCEGNVRFCWVGLGEGLFAGD